MRRDRRRAYRPAVRTRFIYLSVISTVLAGSLVMAAQPAHAIPIWWHGAAYVWSNNSTSALGVPYTPSLSYQFNTTGATNRITRLGTGWYEVRFPFLGPLGTALVTAYGGTTDRCKISHWTGVAGSVPNSTDTVLYVRCYTRTGNAVNSRFTASYTFPDAGEVPRAAYLWNDQASAPLDTPYTPSLTYQYNSEGGTNTITRFDTGFYLVRLAGLHGPITTPRQLQVVAHGLPTADPSAYCEMNSSPIGDPPDVEYWVTCVTAAGTPIDSRFVLTYVESGNHILWPTASFPTAHIGVACGYGGSNNCHFSWPYDTNPSGSISFAELATGQYALYLPVDLTGGNVQVTTYWPTVLSRGRCGIAFWSPSAGVRINCFDHYGAPADATFVMGFVTVV